MNATRVQILVGTGIMVFGIVLAFYIYGVFTDPEMAGKRFTLSNKDKEKVPLEVFKYALFTIAAGAGVFLYKFITDHQENRRKKIELEIENTKQFRSDIIEIFTDLKCARRLFRSSATFGQTKMVNIHLDEFNRIYADFARAQSRIEALQWRLEDTESFLGDSQNSLREQIDLLETYTNKIVHEADFLSKKSTEGIVSFKKNSTMYGFLQAAQSDNNVKLHFFEPMREARKILRVNASSLEAK